MQRVCQLLRILATIDSNQKQEKKRSHLRRNDKVEMDTLMKRYGSLATLCAELILLSHSTRICVGSKKNPKSKKHNSKIKFSNSRE